MDAAAIVIVVVNAILAVGCGWPLAAALSRLRERPAGRVPSFAVLLAVYVVEAAAFAASMGTGVFGAALAVIWGLMLGSWLPNSRIPESEWRRIVLLTAIYTTLPAASFLSVPVTCALGGWPVLDAEAGARFGVPAFLPWPLNTILGLSVLVAGCAVVAKLAVTVSTAGVVVRRRLNVETGTRGRRN